MRLYFLIISVLFSSLCSRAQNFKGCGTGLDSKPYGLYNDTVLNKLIVFGDFTKANGKLIRGIATWDGSDFDSLGTGDHTCNVGSKQVMIRYKNRLYVQFSGGYLHAYDYLTKQWQQIPERINGPVNDATVFNDELYLVGEFNSVGSLPARNVIKFDGSSFDTLPQPFFSYYLQAVEAYKGEIYIGGLFDPAPFQGVAKFNGAQWVSPSPGFSLKGNPTVWDFQLYNDKLFMCGNWSMLNDKFNPSCTAFDGNKWYHLGSLTFGGGIPAALSTFKVFNNKLYVFGGMDYVDSIRTENIGVWNDTVWCGVKMQENFGLQNVPVENYNNHWYFVGGETMYGDTTSYTLSSPQDTVNYLGIYIGNHAKLERSCFDKNEPISPEIPEGLYPNPTTKSVHFNFSSQFGDFCNLKVYNSLGQLLSSYQNMSSKAEIDLDIWPVGLYLFCFEGNGIRKNYKVLKE